MIINFKEKHEYGSQKEQSSTDDMHSTQRYPAWCGRVHCFRLRPPLYREDCPVCAAVESVSGLLVSGDAPREQTVATAALVITVEILLVSSRLEERSDPVTMRVRLLN